MSNSPIIQGAAALSGVPARLDASTSLFLDNELRNIDERVFIQPKPALSALSGLFPIKSDFLPWQTTYTYRQIDSVGKAAIMAPSSGAFPVVNINRSESETAIVKIACAVLLDAGQIEAAAALGIPLEDSYFMAAKRAIEEQANTLAWVGDDDSGVAGLLTTAGIGRAAAGNALASGTSAANNLVELNKLANSAPNASGQVEAPDIALLPPDSYQAVAQQQFSAASDTSTLNFWRATNGYIGEARPIRELSSASILVGQARTLTDCAVSFRRDPMALEFLFSGIRRLPMMQTGPLSFQVPFVAYCGGMAVRLPKSVMLITGV